MRNGRDLHANRRRLLLVVRLPWQTTTNTRGNKVARSAAPQEMFRKMMSSPDELMWSYYQLVTDRTEKEIAELKNGVAAGELHPMDAKMKLAEEVVSVFQGVEAGRKAAENFQRVFRDRQAPTESP